MDEEAGSISACAISNGERAGWRHMELSNGIVVTEFVRNCPSSAGCCALFVEKCWLRSAWELNAAIG